MGKRPYQLSSLLITDILNSAKECPEPRSAEGVECKKCSEGMYRSKFLYNQHVLTQPQSVTSVGTALRVVVVVLATTAVRLAIESKIAQMRSS